MFARRNEILQLIQKLENAGQTLPAGRLRVLLNVYEKRGSSAARELAYGFVKTESVPNDEALRELLREILGNSAVLQDAFSQDAFSQDALDTSQARLGRDATSADEFQQSNAHQATHHGHGHGRGANSDPSARQVLRREGEDRVYDAGTYQMLWDCGYCSTKRLLGLTHRFCPNCGGPQDPEWRYFPSEKDMIAVHDHYYVGRDIICPACSAANAASTDFCQQCGSPLKDGVQAKLYTERTAPTPLSQPRARGLSKRQLITIGTVVVALVVAAIVLMTWTRDTTVRVAGYTWEREIRIDDFLPRPQNDWCDSMPRDAYRISRSRRQRGSRQVPDGETCSTRNVDRGDGSFRRERVCSPKYRSEPIYDDHCSYTVDRWAYARKAASADSGRNPAWPELRLASNEREASRTENYFLELRTASTSKSKDYRCKVEQNFWQAADEGSSWRLKVGAVAGEPRCNSLEPSR